jgi:hypothetical protein
MDESRCSHRTGHDEHLQRGCRAGGPPVTPRAPRRRLVPHSRPADESDPPCPCGRPALFIFTTECFGDVTWCGA